MKRKLIVNLALGVFSLWSAAITNASSIDFESLGSGPVGVCSDGPTCVFQSGGITFSFTSDLFLDLSDRSNMIIADRRIFPTVQNETHFLMTTRIPELGGNGIHPLTITFEPTVEVSFDLDLVYPLASYRLNALDATGQIFDSIIATSDARYTFRNPRNKISSLQIGLFSTRYSAGFAIDNIRISGSSHAKVPESSSFLLLASGLVGLAVWRRAQCAS